MAADLRLKAMRRLRITGLTFGVIAAVVFAALLFARAAFGTTDTGRARADVQKLFERAGHRTVDVGACRLATEEDVDSPTRDTFVCGVSTQSCAHDFIVFARSAVEPGWLDGDTLRPPRQPTHAYDPSEVYRFCDPR